VAARNGTMLNGRSDGVVQALRELRSQTDAAAREVPRAG
jgi:hypothetical protein